MIYHASKRPSFLCFSIISLKIPNRAHPSLKEIVKMSKTIAKDDNDTRPWHLPLAPSIAWHGRPLNFKNFMSIGKHNI